MKKDEGWYRNKLVIPALTEWGFHVQHHEDRIYPDIPDLSFGYGNAVDGWIELKYSADLPAKSFRHRDFTKGQETWLRTRARAGQSYCYLLWGTERRHVLVRSHLFGVYIGAPVSKILKDANQVPGLIIKPTIVDAIKTLRMSLPSHW